METKLPQSTVEAMARSRYGRIFDTPWERIPTDTKRSLIANAELDLQTALDEGSVVLVKDLETDERALVPKAYLDDLRKIAQDVEKAIAPIEHVHPDQWRGLQHPVERLRQELKR